MIIDATIGHPNWEACETCKNHTDDGCDIDIELELHLGDFILCKQYEKELSDEADVRKPCDHKYGDPECSPCKDRIACSY